MKTTIEKSWEPYLIPSEGVTTLTLILVAENPLELRTLEGLYWSTFYTHEPGIAYDFEVKALEESEQGVKKLSLAMRFSHHSKENKDFFQSL